MRRACRGAAVAAAVVASLAAAPSAFAHGASAPAPALPDVLAQWAFDPLLVIALAGTAAIYVWAVRRVNAAHPGTPVPRRRVVFFAIGLGAIAVALLSPIERYEGSLFSVHMTQHLLLTLIMPPLLLIGVPGWLIRPLLARWPALLALGRALTHPVAAFTLFNVIFIGYHVPAVYGLAQESEPLHILGHLLFMATGVITWWPVLSPLRELPPLAPPLQMLYLFLQTLPSQALGALLTFNATPLYEHYAAAPRVWGFMTAQADQELGGLIMWVIGGTFFLGAFAAVFLRWAQLNEAAERRVSGRIYR